jgi:hypothetical protein
MDPPIPDTPESPVAPPPPDVAAPVHVTAVAARHSPVPMEAPLQQQPQAFGDESPPAAPKPMKSKPSKKLPTTTKDLVKKPANMQAAKAKFATLTTTTTTTAEVKSKKKRTIKEDKPSRPAAAKKPRIKGAPSTFQLPPVLTLTAEQRAVNEQMRRALEEDRYSAVGSIVHGDTDDDEDDPRGMDSSSALVGDAGLVPHAMKGGPRAIPIQYYRFQGAHGPLPCRVDRVGLQQAIKQHRLRAYRAGNNGPLPSNKTETILPSMLKDYDDYYGAPEDNNALDQAEDGIDPDDEAAARQGGRGAKEMARSQRSRKKPRAGQPRDDHKGAADILAVALGASVQPKPPPTVVGLSAVEGPVPDDLFATADPDRDGGSIFGQTAGSAANSTWVECDKCKKWRRLRGVVDEKKLPAKVSHILFETC